MSRHTDRWGDDDDRPSRPRRSSDSGGMSPVAIILLVLGGVFVVAVVGCGGLIWLGYQKAQDREQQAIAAAEAERADEQRVRDNIGRIGGANADPLPNIPNPFGDLGAPDKPPPPKPGFEPAAEPPPQPKPTALATDDPKNPDRWRVLFRSKKPQLWNTNTQNGDDFAIPLRSTPADTRYLRLRRMDTGEAIIIPMTRGRIGRVDAPDRKARWNGEGKDEFGGYHLGIAEGAVARFMEGQGTIGVLMDGWDAHPGSGFGHAHHIENGGQRFSWRGKELSPTVFEVAVTTGEPTEAERKWLRE